MELKPKILVVGDLILDHYIWGNCERISPEAPVQVIEVNKETLNLGGACNVANNLIAFDSEVFISGIIGEDNAGSDLLNALKKLKINTQGILKNPMRPTTQKSRIMASHQQVVRVDREDKSEITKEDEKKLIDFIKNLIKKENLNCVILSDYNKGLLSTTLTQSIIQLAKENDIKILIDPKGKDYSKYKGATLLTPNKKEVQLATNITITDDKSLKEACLKLKEICNLEYSLITLSEDGIGILDESLHKIPTIAKEVFDVTGAGDTVIAALSFMLAQNEKILPSVYFANAAAAVVVSKIGSATANKQEIFSYLQRNNLLDSSYIDADFLSLFKTTNAESFLPQIQKISQKQKIADFQSKYITNLESFLVHLKDLKEKGFKVVFTNGCFDILHFGHIKYLNQARNLGDLLIIGLNSDESIKRLKGQNRPINSLYDRAMLLCALECVDFVIDFAQDTPLDLITKIKPDILVKGGDYKDKEVIGSAIAKEVHLIDFVDGKSTTQMIKKIKKG